MEKTGLTMINNIKVILVEPEIPENVGFVVRTMHCYGISQLALVRKPRYRARSLAFKTGHVGNEILKQAQYTSTVEEAIADCQYAVGFSRRHRKNIGIRSYTLQEAAPLLPFPQKVALVFGKESQGLSTEDCLPMDRMIHIPMVDEVLSLNLSHAVTVVLHEIFTRVPYSQNPIREESLARTQGRKLAEPPSEENDPRTGKKWDRLPPLRKLTSLLKILLESFLVMATEKCF
jgi:TrmH family RNA methyltransferase